MVFECLPAFFRPTRAKIGWLFVFCTGFAIWGGGYALQLWADNRTAQDPKQDIDYTRDSISAGPMMLYIFYVGYDAVWQGFAYWLIGTVSNSAERTAILVGGYKSVQALGDGMTWSCNAQKSSMLQFGVDWSLCIASLIIVLPTILTVSQTTKPEVEAMESEDKVEKA